MPNGKGRSAKIASSLAIIVVSATLGILVDWRAPGIARYARDWLVRARGPLPPPEDIAIVAIDEPSLARFGRFPWSRQVIARTLDTLATAQPKVIALDVLFTDATTQEDDDALAFSIGHAGNVVVAAQLTESPVHGGPSQWLLPIPAVQQAAAAVGHVNVQTELEGIPRQVELCEGDDSGRVIRAMALETVRIADGTPEQGILNNARAMLVGARTIPIDTAAPSVVIAQAKTGTTQPEVLRNGRMTIDFIGPAGSFAPRTYSLAEVVDGTVPPSRFTGKYVLIGATAASMGDRLTSPFIHQTDPHGDQHGAFMPGVEVLANELNTILRGRFLSETSGAAAFFWAAMAALLTLALLEFAQGGHEVLRQLEALAAVALLIVMISYFSFTKLFAVPPLVPATVSFASAGILVLLHRTLAASSRLDAGIAELAASGDILISAPAAKTVEPGWLPHGLEWKVQTIGELNASLLDRARFVDCALRSVDDGLIIAAPDGCITFANPSAAEILGSAPGGLVGQSLLERLGVTPAERSRLVEDRARIEREIAMRGVRPRQYILRMAAVASGDDEHGPVLGLVASLSDITRQHELQQTKNDVISLVSHEMRTPLTAIQGMTELLAGYELDADRRREMHLAINDEVKRLTRMITEYLDITRLESGATVLRRAPVRVDQLLERILLMLEPVARSHKIRLGRDFQANLPALIADADLLSRAVENLVSNAIKYSPDSTQVTVSASSNDAAILIEVADQGYGIPESDLERVFEKFYRVPRVQDAGTPGTGLGLAMVREIAELHGGSVSVKSEVGAGSTFSLHIPRAQSQ